MSYHKGKKKVFFFNNEFIQVQIFGMFKYHILKFLNFFVLLCSVVIQTSIFQMKVPTFYCKYYKADFFFKCLI